MSPYCSRPSRFGYRGLTAVITWGCLMVASAWAQPGIPKEGPPSVPRSYRIPPAALESVVEKIRAQFPIPLARVASEPRSSRLIVMAAPDVQRQVESFLKQELGEGVLGTEKIAPPPPPPPPASAINSSPSMPLKAQATVSPEQPVERRILLPEPRQQLRVGVHHHKVAELQQQIQKIWGTRAGQAETANHSVDLQLPGAKGDLVDISVDHVNQQLVLTGGPTSLQAWSQVITALDQPANDAATTSVVAPRTPHGALPRLVSALQQGLAGTDAIRLLRMGHAGAKASASSVQTLLQADDTSEADEESAQDNQVTPEPPTVPGIAEDGGGGLIGPVQIYFLDGLDGVIVRGNKRDVDRVTQIISEIERLSSETVPEIKILPLQHVQSERLYELIRQIYTEALATRQGDVSITALVKPNSLLLIGRPENVKVVVDLVQQLDQPVEPDSQFQVIQLKHMSALDAQQTITNFYAERPGLGTTIRVAADYRTNTIVIQGGPRDLVEVTKLLERMDVAESAAVSEVRVFRLKNALADELVPVLEDAFRINQQTQGGAGVGGGFGGAGGQGGVGGQGGLGQTGQLLRPKSTVLTLLQLDAEGKRLLRSGILADARVSADPRANAVVVTAPTESMELIAELISQLDALPGAEAQIKVFTVSNGDAVSLAEMLQELFGEAANQGNQNGPAIQSAGGGEDGTLVPLRFTVDERTNTIIASGSLADLEVVEAILLKLDEDDSRQRQSTVYRLRNSYSVEVAAAINEFLRSERTVQEIAPSAISPFEQIEREVVVVAQESNNALIISATPRYYDEIMRVIKQLDERPPMVMIQVLIAEVTLNNLEEFGIELGLQDSFLFDRGVIANNTITPGFNFNNQPLGNASSAAALASAGTIGSQGLSNFGVGRTNGNLGYGGLVLSASSDSVSVLVRALEQEGRLNVLSRPQIMTLDNQYAFVQVGQRVPYITSSQVTQAGVINSTQFLDTGIVLQVKPRISPDGLVVMLVEASKSDISSEEGIPVSVSAVGVVIRSPIFNTTRAQTVVSARSGQTVVLSGLITTSRAETHRGVPYLSDLPLLGRLFQFDSLNEERTELLFILTPYIVKGDEDVEWLKAVETDRMHWCMSDVAAVHGDLSGNAMPTKGELQTIYPDQAPQAELVPAPDQNVPTITSPDGTLQGPNVGNPHGATDVPSAPSPGLDQQTSQSPQNSTPSRTPRLVTNVNEIVPSPPAPGRPGRAVQLRAGSGGTREIDMSQSNVVTPASADDRPDGTNTIRADYRAEPPADKAAPPDKSGSKPIPAKSKGPRNWLRLRPQPKPAAESESAEPAPNSEVRRR